MFLAEAKNTITYPVWFPGFWVSNYLFLLLYFSLFFPSMFSAFHTTLVFPPEERSSWSSFSSLDLMFPRPVPGHSPQCWALVLLWLDLFFNAVHPSHAFRKEYVGDKVLNPGISESVFVSPWNTLTDIILFKPN